MSSAATPPRDASVTARLGSCDAAIVRKAVDELFGDPQTLQEPLMLFHAASAERIAGHREEAAFLYLTARLRTSRQILFEKGDRPQLLSIMLMTSGPLVMPILEADPELARRVVKRVIDWDSSTPDPFREREAAKSGEIAEKLAVIGAGLARLPDQLRDDPARVAQARKALGESERQIEASYAQRCGPGTLDPADAEAATKRIQSAAESLARTHPFVVAQAGGEVKSVNVGTYRMSHGSLPTRLTVSVSPASGKAFYAEVDAEATITPERKLGGVKMSLACVTDLWIGQRDASWKNVCADDPKARKPSAATTGELKPFDVAADEKSRQNAAQKTVCGFADLKLPEQFSVFAAGAYSGREIAFQIDQSGHQGTQIDVAVNSPGKPVVLMLGAYEPTIWNIGWSPQTRIAAVLVGGYHRQAVAGLEPSTPLLNSSYDNKGACGYFYVTPDNLAPLNPLSKRVFGRGVDMVFPATNGKVVIGKPLATGVSLITSGAIVPESFHDRTAPMAGPAGLADAVRKGLLRKATAADAEAWSEAVMQSNPQRDLPPVAGKGVLRPPKPGLFNAYVVLKPFTYPSGLYGGNSASFLIPKGVPKPEGNSGHSSVYDINTLNCQGALCSAR
ncbi:MAG: hypothetical protein A3F78_16325 [Burkholderiales bacterium RIFCSPLOWO2_12_FULL_61_40]|nr:MAG: hypothetical protein A3F78_16325 [Burkholderiales bacterium RIFCSPLOWO2_12_FULL_61_40]